VFSDLELRLRPDTDALGLLRCLAAHSGLGLIEAQSQRDMLDR
jgi:hypothetical protein